MVNLIISLVYDWMALTYNMSELVIYLGHTKEYTEKLIPQCYISNAIICLGHSILE